MAYVTGDGQIQSDKPWSIHRIVGLFWALVAFLVCFFRSLLQLDPPRNSGSRNDNSSRRRPPGGFRTLPTTFRVPGPMGGGG